MPKYLDREGIGEAEPRIQVILLLVPATVFLQWPARGSRQEEAVHSGVGQDCSLERAVAFLSNSHLYEMFIYTILLSI